MPPPGWFDVEMPLHDLGAERIPRTAGRSRHHAHEGLRLRGRSDEHRGNGGDGKLMNEFHLFPSQENDFFFFLIPTVWGQSSP